MVEILRPMSTGELMDRTLVLYKKNFKLFIRQLGACYLPAVPVAHHQFSLTSGGDTNRVNPISAAALGFGFLAGITIMLAGMAIAHAATVKAVAAVHLGRSIRIQKLTGLLRDEFGA